METVGSERLETSALGLTFQVKPKYVKHGLKLECTASIGSVYWQSFQDSPKVSPREQPAISGNWWTSSHASSKGSFINYLRILRKKSVKKLWIVIDLVDNFITHPQCVPIFFGQTK